MITYHAQNKRELERVGFLLVDLNIESRVNHDKPLDIEINGTPISKLCAAASNALDALQNIEVNLTGRDYFPERVADSLKRTKEAIEFFSK